jgi:hypothetical protein
MTLDAGDEAAGRVRFGTVPPPALHCGEAAPQRAKQGGESIDDAVAPPMPANDEQH